ncbi:hypothetical protein GOBAR_DD07440 [Gossypium barbadense]|nr:hypothetical protein GOBAR_DD07440 [Gossypium barbadense]
MASSNTSIPVDDGFNEYESDLKRQKCTTSKVWDEMTKLECENKNELKAQCNHYVLDYWGQQDKDYKMFALSNDEWRNVVILCKILKVLYDATCVFSSSNYPTNNLYYKGVWKVHKVLLDTVKGPY